MAFNAIDFIFITLAIIIVFFGEILNNFGKYAPAFLHRIYLYGSFSYEGSEANYVRHIEIPKSKLFRHMYIFTSVFSSFWLFYLVLVYFCNIEVNECVRSGFKVLLGDKEPVSGIAALTTMCFFTIQSWRRMCETHWLQVFAQSSKMNVPHYMLGFLHYAMCSVAIAGQAPLFCVTQTRNKITWTDTPTLIVIVPCLLLFIWASYEQHQSNVILADLRRSKKTGRVVTEEYRVPCGRLYEYVSSPHRTMEIVIYAVLAILMQTKTYFFIFVWVASNQIQSALLAHRWYKKTFKNYPTDRYAIFPYLL